MSMIRDGFKNFVDWWRNEARHEVVLFDVNNTCTVCHKKEVHVTLSKEVRFCSYNCKGQAFKRFEEYQGKKKCKYPGCDKKCYVENNGIVYDFCDRTHAMEFKKQQVCKLPGCQLRCFAENGKVHDFCCKSHADKYQKNTCGFHVLSRQPLQSHGYFLRPSTGPIHFYNRDDPYYEFTNFATYPVKIDDKVWPTTEHYFQAQKFIGTPYVEYIRTLPAPRLAFDFSRKPEVSHWRRNDWEQVKEKVMEKALWAKFTQHSELHKMLLDTGGRRLVEHTSNDRYWGDGGDGSGKNRLGNLLMDVRQKLRQGKIYTLPYKPKSIEREEPQAASSTPEKDGGDNQPDLIILNDDSTGDSLCGTTTTPQSSPMECNIAENSNDSTLLLPPLMPFTEATSHPLGTDATSTSTINSANPDDIVNSITEQPPAPAMESDDGQQPNPSISDEPQGSNSNELADCVNSITEQPPAPAMASDDGQQPNPSINDEPQGSNSNELADCVEPMDTVDNSTVGNDKI
ncbi:uncharacterized protein [Dysidea avara]|uniref:uncharacterized protein isoform X2 n=1 Tax=Dysidea avara TaxID=196820 RepID=UPI00332804B8